jgi:hypothetical protein
MLTTGASPVIGPCEWVVPAFTRGRSHACQKIVEFPRKTHSLSRTRHSYRGCVWSHPKSPTGDWEEPAGSRAAGTFSKFHSLPQINRGALASGTVILCFFCDSAAYFH